MSVRGVHPALRRRRGARAAPAAADGGARRARAQPLARRLRTGLQGEEVRTFVSI